VTLVNKLTYLSYCIITLTSIVAWGRIY